jgi:hypothetical protein
MVSNPNHELVQLLRRRRKRLVKVPSFYKIPRQLNVIDARTLSAPQQVTKMGSKAQSTPVEPT